MKRVLVLHGYSAANLGDGLLVEEALSIIRSIFGQETLISLCASHPDSFSETPGVEILDSGLGPRGYNRRYIRALRSISDYDLVIGVGGGYLRGGYPSEFLKTLLVHGPQLAAASRRGQNVVYLPQSVGPFGPGARQLVRMALGRLQSVMVRDDRSHEEVRTSSVIRVPDLAALAVKSHQLAFDREAVPVLSVRAVRGKVPDEARALANRLGTFDGYVQSTSAGNDDRTAMYSMQPRTVLGPSELLERPQTARVVVAVRLHAALMALQAGHFVVHLAYERKGFGAFADLGLDKYVHNYNSFRAAEILEQVEDLRNNEETRAEYRGSLLRTERTRTRAYKELVGIVRNASQ